MKRIRAGLLGAALAASLGCAQSGDGRFQRDLEDAATAPDVVAVDVVTRDVVTVDVPAVDRPPVVDVVIPDGGARTATCLPCTTQEQCGAEGRCVALASGQRACLPICNPDVPSCPGTLRCVLDVALSNAPVCAPVGGVCCIDPDGDMHGVGVACRGADCDEADPMVNASAAEQCNGRDDNCNRAVDESLTRACTTPCGDSTQTCFNANWTACAVMTTRMEVCDNRVDDDCDGMIDEGCTTTVCTANATRSCYPGPPGTSGVGTCRAGTERCATNGQSWGACTGAVVPASESCGNSLDDDCDGMTDEGCTTMTVPMCTGGPQVEDSAGNYMVLANYDGGDLVIDVDAPLRSVGVLAYEPVTIELRGAHAAAVQRVHVVGFNSMTATVRGTGAGATVERAGMPMATLADSAGNARMVCGSVCAPGSRPGGCNTLAQVLDYFQQTLGGTRRAWHLQYRTFTGGTFRVSAGGCCG
ncbi:MAG: putative metal-binding motif-containing protein [Polyangiales bacterium]